MLMMNSPYAVYCTCVLIFHFFHPLIGGRDSVIITLSGLVFIYLCSSLRSGTATRFNNVPMNLIKETIISIIEITLIFKDLNCLIPLIQKFRILRVFLC